jgi:hypothetical protein
MLIESPLPSDSFTWYFVCMCAQACPLRLYILLYCVRLGGLCAWWSFCLLPLNLITLQCSCVPDCTLLAADEFVFASLVCFAVPWVHL